MSVIRIRGSNRLNGKIKIQGSKNAVLPVMAASLLHRGTVTVDNVPRIQDVFCMMGILEHLGCRCCLEGHRLTICAREAEGTEIPGRLARQMRSSIMLLGPMVARFGRGVTTYPGGCPIGRRPIDLHLYSLRCLGAEVRTEGERVLAAADRLEAGRIVFSYPSVGATENAVLAAAAARGTTEIWGAAKEPEVEALCLFLQAMGCGIGGIGTSHLTVEGGRPLSDASFVIPGDRIVAGTYLGAAVSAGGFLLLEGAPAGHMGETLRLARQMGASCAVCPEGVLVGMEKRPMAVNAATGPYPEFSTDLQSVLMASAASAQGVSRICETVFEGRFLTAKELRRLGAHIIIEGSCAQVEGVETLSGGLVQAEDLRGGAALVVAGLAAEGETFVSGCRHIERGYEDICGDLQAAGADIHLIEKS